MRCGRRGKEKIRRRLTRQPAVRREETAFESRQKPGHAERRLHLEKRSVRYHAHRHIESVEHGLHAPYGANGPSPELGVKRRSPGIEEIGGQGPAEPLLD